QEVVAGGGPRLQVVVVARAVPGVGAGVAVGRAAGAAAPLAAIARQLAHASEAGADGVPVTALAAGAADVLPGAPTVADIGDAVEVLELEAGDQLVGLRRGQVARGAVDHILDEDALGGE